MEQELETITLGGGCFWCLEAVFQQLEGVESVVSGYMGGHLSDPNYHQVCRGDTGHAEVVQLRFDPERLSLDLLLDVFFAIHDPTTLNRQGNDVGTQYRSVIFTHAPAQTIEVQHKLKQLDASGTWPQPIVTEVAPAGQFYSAEAYHQNYFALNEGQGYCQFVVAPKVAKFRKLFRERLKTE